MPCSHELIERKWGLSDWSASVSLASFRFPRRSSVKSSASSAVLPTCAALTAEEQTEDFAEEQRMDGRPMYRGCLHPRVDRVLRYAAFKVSRSASSRRTVDRKL